MWNTNLVYVELMTDKKTMVMVSVRPGYSVFFFLLTVDLGVGVDLAGM
jgi:hypothetical protein